ncbi:putative uncharacterized protein DDB_G0277255 isoform X1 [Hydra vulgaris]|uniref:putative uncharacterized protein DDB_G0277255 isoform X1 n=1 Tax=Hydra vulgaris TaxID=6087 RepID=UPI001F5EF497|nr:putative uncharacterized protein DDB_G0277255 [Hydra vulgaris]
MELINPFNDQYFGLFGNNEHSENEMLLKSPSYKNEVLNVDVPKYSKIDKTIIQESHLQNFLKVQKESQNKNFCQAQVNMCKQKKNFCQAQVNMCKQNKNFCQAQLNMSKQITKNDNTFQSEKYIKNLSQKDKLCLFSKNVKKNKPPLGIINTNNQSEFPSNHQKNLFGFTDYLQKNQLPESFYFSDSFTQHKCESELYKKSLPCEPFQIKDNKSLIFREKVEPIFHGSVPIQRSLNSFDPSILKFTKIRSYPANLDHSFQEENPQFPVIMNDKVSQAHERYYANLGVFKYQLLEQNEVCTDLWQNNDYFPTESHENKQNHFYSNKFIDTPKNYFQYSNTTNNNCLIGNPNEVFEGSHSSKHFLRAYNPHTYFYNNPSLYAHFQPFDVSSYINTSVYPPDIGMQLINDQSHNIWQDSTLNENNSLFAKRSFFSENSLNCTYQSNNVLYNNSNGNNNIHSDFYVKSKYSCGDVESPYFSSFCEAKNVSINCTDQENSAINPITKKNDPSTSLLNSVSILENTMLFENKQCISALKKQKKKNKNAKPILCSQPDIQSKQRIKSISEGCEKRKSTNTSNSKLKRILDQPCINSSKHMFNCCKCIICNDLKSNVINNNVVNCTHNKRQKMDVDFSSKEKIFNGNEDEYKECLKDLTVDISFNSQQQQKNLACTDKNLLFQKSQCDNNVNNKMDSDLLVSRSFLNLVPLRSFDASPSQILSKSSSKKHQDKNRKISRTSSKQKMEFVKKKMHEQQSCYEKVCFYFSNLKKENQQECFTNYLIFDNIKTQLELCVTLNLSIRIETIVFRRSQHKWKKVQSFNRIFIAIFLNSYKKMQKTRRRKQLNPKKRSTQQYHMSLKTCARVKLI